MHHYFYRFLPVIPPSRCCCWMWQRWSAEARPTAPGTVPRRDRMANGWYGCCWTKRRGRRMVPRPLQCGYHSLHTVMALPMPPLMLIVQLARSTLESPRPGHIFPTRPIVPSCAVKGSPMGCGEGGEMMVVMVAALKLTVPLPRR